MKCVLFLSIALALLPTLSAQQPLPVDAALSRLYPHFNPTYHTAQWDCSAPGHERKNDEWPCSTRSSTVRVSVILYAEFREGKTEKTLLVTSAHLTNDQVPDCHACQPAIGMAVFAHQTSGWQLEAENPVVGKYGSWGEPPDVELVNVGPDKYGVLLSQTDGGQGYHRSEKHLLIPLGNTVKEVWSIEDEQDDFGAYDPAGVDGPSVAYRSSAAFRFSFDEEVDSASDPYYHIEVISRGTDSANNDGRLQPENWTAIYHFQGGKYRLLSRKVFEETKSHAARTPRAKK